MTTIAAVTVTSNVTMTSTVTIIDHGRHCSCNASSVAVTASVIVYPTLTLMIIVLDTIVN